ncbi:MAG: TonB-dependent receptor [Betaproteobacteria bacterium]|nr:TonB-dependent receptor [Betaproteobacteria bacterium]
MKNSTFSGVGNYFTPVILPTAPDPLAPAVSYRQRETGFYGQDTLSFGSSWKLVLGGRQTTVERVATGAAEFDWSRSVFTPNVALLFKPRADVSTYLSYAKGLEQGDQAPVGTTNQNQLLDPLASRQVEAGVKWDVIPELNLQSALFRIEKPLEYVDAANTWIQNGKQVHTGIEMGECRRQSHTRPDVIRRRHAAGFGTAIDWRPGARRRQKANVAKRRASVFLEYAPPGTGLAFNGRWQHVASRPANDDNTAWVDGYHVFGVGARYSATMAGVPIVLGLSVDNLFDKNY